MQQLSGSLALSSSGAYMVPNVEAHWAGVESPRVRIDRESDFRQVLAALSGHVVVDTRRGLVVQGDSLELLRLIPTNSISLIVTDPPYHSTKKANITGDRGFEVDEHYLEWMERYAQEWHRVLRRNGSLYLFCSTEMSARLEMEVGKHLRPLSHITWTKPNGPGFDGWKGKMQKEALRRWYPHSERILFFEQASPDHERRSSLGALLREARDQAGVSAHELTGAIGAYGKVNHGGAVSNWETGRNIPSREQWAKIVEVLEATGRVRDLPAYEDAVRPFFLSKHVDFMDVWEFPSVRVYRGKHPAEKPISLLSHIVETSSYAGDLVLDCFSGSGASLGAAVGVNRRAVGIELDPHWATRSAERLVRADDAIAVTTVRQLKARRDQKAAQGAEPLF